MQNLQSNKNTSGDTIMMDTCHTFVQAHRCTTPRVNINVNYELWKILMCQYRFINFNKGATVVEDVKMGKAMDTWQNEIYIYIYEAYVYVCVCIQLVIQSFQTLCNPMECNTPESSVHKIPQARILGWVAIPSSRVSS